ncbi:hypothetical protein BCR42DRAFT_405975 [Absidia repens]|uniref:Uncharacterized protein n=1 Tax=Absidia repens TaxID=90262 RepID=A0A1X2IU72_9FUNG|nr:hypothetical protein BCR42DRAFT_405975 [Absidia repens]
MHTLLFPTTLIVFITLLFVQSTIAVKQQQQHLSPTYRTPKNILFACTIGGSSHANWVLAILNDLNQRGHNATFATRDDHARFGIRYGINTISVGPATIPKDNTTYNDNAHLDPHSVMGTLIGHVVDAYPSEYIAFRDLIETRQIDLVICDHFVDSCIEAAKFHGKPFVITSTLAIAPDARASFISSGISLYGVHNNQISLFERIYHNYLFTGTFLWKNFATLMKVGQTKTDLGLVSSPDTMASWKDAMKLVNTAFGLENARALGPLVEFIGPILPLHYQPITSTTYETFLDNHSRTIYVAFGQNANPSLLDRSLLWSSLLSLLEDEVINGVVWADAHITAMEKEMTFTTIQHTTYSLAQINDHPNVLLTSWSPQMAILQHPSTVAFLTHGGAGSLHESLYAGVPMAVFPFVGDQLGLARNIEEQGLGVYLRRDVTINTTATLIRDLVKGDKSLEIQNNVQRYSALIQIHSQHGVQRGADLIEEVLFAGVSHRLEASRSMSIIKVYNLDIYFIFSLLAFGGLLAIYSLLLQIHHLIVGPKSQQQNLTGDYVHKPKGQ